MQMRTKKGSEWLMGRVCWTKEGLMSWVVCVGQHKMSSPYSNKSYKLYISKIFHLIFPDHGWPQVTETREDSCISFIIYPSLSFIHLYHLSIFILYPSTNSSQFRKHFKINHGHFLLNTSACILLQRVYGSFTALLFHAKIYMQWNPEILKVLSCANAYKKDWPHYKGTFLGYNNQIKVEEGQFPSERSQG